MVAAILIAECLNSDPSLFTVYLQLLRRHRELTHHVDHVAAHTLLQRLVERLAGNFSDPTAHLLELGAPHAARGGGRRSQTNALSLIHI